MSDAEIYHETTAVETHNCNMVTFCPQKESGGLEECQHSINGMCHSLISRYHGLSTHSVSAVLPDLVEL